MLAQPSINISNNVKTADEDLKVYEPYFVVSSEK